MNKEISAKELDSLFDNGEDITPYLDADSRRNIKDFALKETKKVNINCQQTRRRSR